MRDLTESEIRDALSFVDPHDRDTWVRMGMAVRSHLGAGGFDTWNSWSSGADNYNTKAATAVWRSLKATGGVAGSITIGTLIAALVIVSSAAEADV